MTVDHRTAHPRRCRDGQSSAASRRLDLDWLRIAAFGLLILYHIALVFSPWDWHINSRYRADWVGVALVATNPWRLGLLFLISGVATRFLVNRLGPLQLAIDRSRRLLIPLAVGAVFFVPPQAYVEQVVKDGLTTSYPSFWAGQFDPAQIFCLAGPTCRGLPINHLWFVAYIWAYALCGALLCCVPSLVPRIERILGRWMSGVGILAIPFLWLLAVRFALFPCFGVTNHLLADTYNHAASFGLFLIGFLVAFDDKVWAAFAQFRWIGVALAAPSPIYLAWRASLPFGQQHHKAPLTMLMFAVNQWCTIAAILGFGYRHLRCGDGPGFRYLREGVFPFYIIHQTVIVITTLVLERLAIPAGWEFASLTLVTCLICLAAYESVRRIPFLQPAFGLKKRPERAIAGCAAESTSA